MRVPYLVSGALIAAVVSLLGVLTSGFPVYVVILGGMVLGVGVAACLWRLEEGASRPPIGWRWYIWGSLVAVSVVAAVWAEETAEEGCSGTLNDTRRFLATLALVAIGAAAFWLPSSAMWSAFGRDGLSRPAGFLTVAALWLLLWGFLWFVVWRVMFGCVD